MKTCGVFTVTLYPKTVNVLSAPSMKEHLILTRLGFQVLETQDTGSDSMFTDAQHSQNHSETGGGELLLFLNMRYCAQASTDPKSVPLFPRKMDLERGFKDSRTQILAWKFSHHISSKFARSEDFSLELHLNPGHFSLSEEMGGSIYIFASSSMNPRGVSALLPWSRRDGGLKGIPVLFPHYQHHCNVAAVLHVFSKGRSLRCSHQVSLPAPSLLEHFLSFV